MRWIVHAHSLLLVIIEIVYQLRVAILEAEDHAPIAAHGYRPETRQTPRELMQAQAWRVHLIDGLSRIQYAKNPAQPHRVLGNDAGLGTGFKEDAQTGVAKACDHLKSVICCLTDYKRCLWLGLKQNNSTAINRAFTAKHN